MMRLNNKGQSLVLFVLLLPMMMFIMILVIDVGNALCCKQDLSDINYMISDYGLQHYKDKDIENKLVEAINLNCNDLSVIDVSVDDEKIDIKMSKKTNSVFGKIFNIKFYSVNSEYVSNIENKRIERVK